MANFDTSVTAAMTGRNTSPSVIPYQDSPSVDPARRSRKESGRLRTSARFTAIPRTYTIEYNGITATDKDLIRVFEKDTVNGSDSFTWTNPGNSETLTVVFDGPVVYTPWEETNYAIWTVRFRVSTIGGV